MEYFKLLGGLILLIAAGEYLVSASSGIAKHFKLPSLIIGMTIVAFGTSAPELLVSTVAGLNGHPAIALGNVTGSNGVNASLIIGITALICPFYVSRQSITTDSMFMFFISAIMILFGYTGGCISRIEGALMLLLLIAFTAWSIKKAMASPAPATPESETLQKQENEKKERSLWLNIVIVIVSLVGLSIGADFMVDGATNLAKSWGVSERFISVTIVAIGTSLPELTASIIAAIKKEPDLCIGNIIGSNIFNVGAVLGVATMLSPIDFNAAGGEANVTLPQFLTDSVWMFGFELLLLVGMINVTNNFSLFKKSGKFTSFFCVENGLVGRIWGVCAIALYVFYVYLLLIND